MHLVSILILIPATTKFLMPLFANPAACYWWANES